MDDYRGRVAVVTGGASGVGYCLCHQLAEQGMRVVMADVEADRLTQAAAALRGDGFDVTGMQADVSDPDSMDRLAQQVASDVGPVHVLCNNAGVGIKEAQRRMWTLTPNDWQWGFNVNVFGIANGIRAFVPGMLAHGEAGHVVNTSSGNGGLTSLPTTPIYAATKAAVTSMTEVLHYQFLAEGAALRAHVLFPGPHVVNTNILNSMRNRPPELRDDEEPPAYVSMRELLKASGIADPQLTEPEEVAATCLEGMKAGRFWIFPDNEAQEGRIRQRTDDILARRNPPLPE